MGGKLSFNMAYGTSTKSGEDNCDVTLVWWHFISTREIGMTWVCFQICEYQYAVTVMVCYRPQTASMVNNNFSFS